MATLALTALVTLGLTGLSSVVTREVAVGAPADCGSSSIPADTTGCEIGGPVVPGSGGLASRSASVAVAKPADGGTDCTVSPTLPCVVYGTPTITGVSAEGYDSGPGPPVGETDNCTPAGGTSSCSVDVTFGTVGSAAYPYVEIDVAYQYGQGYNDSGGPFPAIAHASFIMATGNVVATGSLTISSVTIDPTAPSATDPRITGTIVVGNSGTVALTSVATAVLSSTPKIVSITSQPKPTSVASLAPGTSTTFTFTMKPLKSGDASIRISGSGQSGSGPVDAKIRTRKFTVDGGITLKLTKLRGPNSAGKAVLNAKVSNPNVNAVSGITLALADVTADRKSATFGKSDPTSFALGGHDSRSFTVPVRLPEVGNYRIAGTATGRSGHNVFEGHSILSITGPGKPLTVVVTPRFKPAQIGQNGSLEVKITNHLNENLTAVTTTASVVPAKDPGRATIGAIPAPLGSVGAGATVTIPVTLTYPGIVPFAVKVTARGVRSGDAVSATDEATQDVIKPVFTVRPTTQKSLAHFALAEDYAGSDWSTAAGSIPVAIEGQNIHTYSQREAFHGSLGLPLWPHHVQGGQDRRLGADACSATFSATQGQYRKKVKVEGQVDRLLLFADADPLLKTNEVLCTNEVNYVDTTPGTAMYFTGPHSGGPSLGISLRVVQAGQILVNAVATADLDICVNLTDGVRDVRVQAEGPRLRFTVATAHCGS